MKNSFPSTAHFAGMQRTVFLRSLARVLMLFAALFAVTGAVHADTVHADSPADAHNRITALKFDDGGNTMLKTTDKALYRSSDAGRTWVQIALPPAVTRHGIAALAIAAKSKDVWYLAGSGFGVLRSADGGQHWAARNTGLPSRQVTALTTHATQRDTVYAYVAGKGIFRSQDGGAHWRKMDRGPHEDIASFVHSDMPGSMQTGWLFAATAKGVRRSMDCFCGWQDAGALATAVRAVSYDPHQPQRVYAITSEGLSVSNDGGEHWNGMKSPGAAAITALIVSPAGVLYAAIGDSLFRSRDQGMTWESVNA